MSFDIRQQVVDQRTGEVPEELGNAYVDQLGAAFAESPEGFSIRNQGIDLGWVTLAVDYGIRYLGVTPADMSPEDLEEILFDIFPEKVAVKADNAAEIIKEMRAFWRFAQRAYGLENAVDCLDILDDDAIGHLHAAMSDPDNYGMGKSFVMLGKQRGFDTTTNEGLRTWMAVYNAETTQQAKSATPELALSGQPKPSVRKVEKHQKMKRKMQNSSRKKNRRKR